MTQCLEDSVIKTFIDCKLNDEETAKVEKHLAECNFCRERLRNFEKEAEPFLEISQSHFPIKSDFTELSQFEDGFFEFIDSETTLELPQIIGFYEIQKVLGKGGMGILYEGEHLMLHRKVAIKFIRHKKLLTPQITERFQQEIISAGKLFHPNIVTTLDAGTYNGQPFLVMELLNGLNMEQYVRQIGPMKQQEAIQATIQAARGLAYAHSFGLIHCDVKPSNLWRCSDGTVKVLDLGLMQLTSALQDSQLHHGGTPFFMSPEQREKREQIDERTDIYSLGCTFYFLLTGQIPESGNENSFNLKATGAKVPKAIQRILNKMTAEKSEKRLKSMAEVEKLLKPYASKRSSRVLIAFGYICMFFSLILVPIVFGPAAITLGCINKKRGSVLHGRIQIYMGIVCFLVGWAIGSALFILDSTYEDTVRMYERAEQKFEAARQTEERISRPQQSPEQKP